MNNYDNPFASSLYTNVRSLHRCNDINGSPVCLDEHGWFWTGLQLLWSNLSRFRFSGENWNGPLATADDLTTALLSQGVSKSSIRSFGAHKSVFPLGQTILNRFSTSLYGEFFSQMSIIEVDGFVPHLSILVMLNGFL